MRRVRLVRALLEGVTPVEKLVLGEIDHHLAFAGLAVNRIELHPVGAGAYNGFAGYRMKIGGSGSVGQSVRVSGTRSAQDAFDERDGPIRT